MPYCSRCGVEVDSGVAACPLCFAPIQKLDDEKPAPPPRYPDPPEGAKSRISDRMRRGIIWEVITLFFMMAVAIVIGCDLLINRRVGWSLYPAAAASLAWLYTTLWIFLRQRLRAFAVAAIIASVGFLAAADLIGGDLMWFVSLGLPISATFFVIAGILAFVVSRIYDKGFNVVAFLLLGAVAFCLGLDAILSIYLTGRARLSWSLIVLLAVVPCSIVFLFLHYRLRGRFDIKRIFRI